MATESVTPLNLGSVDRMSELLNKSMAIADLLQSAGESDAEVPGDTLANVSWTLRDMLIETKQILANRKED